MWPQLLQEAELQDLVTGILAQFQTDLPLSSGSVPRDHSRETDQELLWLKAIRSCPRSLLDLVNSKACRGMSLADSFTVSPKPVDALRSDYVQWFPDIIAVWGSRAATCTNRFPVSVCSWTVSWRSWTMLITNFMTPLSRRSPSLVPLVELDLQTGNLGHRSAPPCDWSKLEVER